MQLQFFWFSRESDVCGAYYAQPGLKVEKKYLPDRSFFESINKTRSIKYQGTIVSRLLPFCLVGIGTCSAVVSLSSLMGGFFTWVAGSGFIALFLLVARLNRKWQMKKIQ